ncbi:MAG: biotin transporter BioY [Acidobacteriaceae bacterium]|nr:biotin transporter BioY [Acidobacteriaceae bacterium]
MHNTATVSRATSFGSVARTLPGRIVLGLAATVVVALAAHVSFPLPFTPVPFILTPLAVLGVGLALGPVAGFASLCAYLLEGAAGLPVFSPSGPGGVLQLMGPTGGYLLSYPLVAALAGGLTSVLRRSMPSFAAATAACSAAAAVLFLSGATWMMHLLPAMSLHTVWIATVAPFLPGEAIKVLAAAGTYSTLTRKQRL